MRDFISVPKAVEEVAPGPLNGYERRRLINRGFPLLLDVDFTIDDFGKLRGRRNSEPVKETSGALNGGDLLESGIDPSGTRRLLAAFGSDFRIDQIAEDQIEPLRISSAGMWNMDAGAVGGSMKIRPGGIGEPHVVEFKKLLATEIGSRRRTTTDTRWWGNSSKITSANVLTNMWDVSA